MISLPATSWHQTVDNTTANPVKTNTAKSERHRSKMDHGIQCEDQNSKNRKGQFTSLIKQTQGLAMISARNCCRSFL
jgi:hypothetical protein